MASFSISWGTTPVAEIYNIKGTAVTDNFKHLSWLNGAIAWETGFIRRLYDYGEIKSTINKTSKKIEEYKAGGHATIRLVHTFFYRVPNSTSSSDFRETQQLKSQNKNNDSEIITKIAHFIHEYSQARLYIPQLYQIMQNKPQDLSWLNKENISILFDPEVKKNVLQEAIKNISNPNLKKEVSQKLNNFIKTNQDTPKKFLNHIQKCAEIIRALFNDVALKSLKNETGKDKIREFLIEALLESDPQNNKAIFQPYTAEIILLAFLYKKIGQQKEKIKQFYEELNKNFNSSFLVKNWSIDDIYKPVSSQEAHTKLQRIFKQKDLNKKINEITEDIVFYATQLNSYPSMNTSQDVKDYEIGGIKDTVSDCMDNAIRNFLRILSYNQTTQQFDMSLLKTRLSPSNQQPQTHNYVKNFFEKYSRPINDCTENAHREWLYVTSNIPYALYARTIINKQRAVATDNKLYGYIFIPQEGIKQVEKIDNQNYLNNKKIEVITEHGYCLVPCVYNIIVLLNYALGLDLLKEENIFNNNFFIKNFQLLTQALESKGFVSTKKSEKEYEPLLNFDQKDFTFDNTFYTTLEFKDLICQFTTNRVHGELNYTIKQNQKTFKIPKINHSQASFINLIFAQLQNKILLDVTSQEFYSNLFILPLEDSNKIDRILKSLKDASTSQLESMLTLLLRVADKQVDEKIKLYLIAKIYHTYLDHGFDNLADSALKAAHQALFTEDKFVQFAGFFLLKKLLEKGYAEENALQIAQKITYSDIKDVQYFGIILYEELIKKNIGSSEEATKIAQAAIESHDTDLQEAGFGLLNTLVELRYSIIDALIIANQALSSLDENVVYAAEKLVKNLSVLVDDNNNTMFHYACARSLTNAVRELLKISNAINDQNSNGLTPLHIACNTKNIEIIKLLLEHEADPQLKNIDGRTPCQSTQNQEIKQLLQKFKHNDQNNDFQEPQQSRKRKEEAEINTEHKPSKKIQIAEED